MRFRADVNNPASFSRLISSLTPLGKVATLKLTSEFINLICYAEGQGVKVFSQIQVASIFDTETLKLESNSKNEIYLEVSTEALGRAFKSVAGSNSVTIKLAKKGGAGPDGTGKGAVPVLSLLVKTASRAGHNLEITQDIAVKVKKASDLEAMAEPLCPPPDVSILLPPLALLRTVSERLKTLSAYITISSNQLGEFHLQAESDEAKVQTEWRGLSHPDPNEDPAAEAPSDKSAFHSVTVDAKSLLKFLASYTIASSTIACICAEHCAIFYVYIGDAKDSMQGGVLTYFIPGIGIGDTD